MAKDDQSLAEVNTCVSHSNGVRPAKQTTFREWMVANQIGKEPDTGAYRLLIMPR